MQTEEEPRSESTAWQPADLVAPEVVREIRSENEALLRSTASIQASLETGRFDEAGPIAAELHHVLVKHVLLVDGVLDALSPDDVGPSVKTK